LVNDEEGDQVSDDAEDVHEDTAELAAVEVVLPLALMEMAEDDEPIERGVVAVDEAADPGREVTRLDRRRPMLGAPSSSSSSPATGKDFAKSNMVGTASRQLKWALASMESSSRSSRPPISSMRAVPRVYCFLCFTCDF
jgi:hypothetical protein